MKGRDRLALSQGCRVNFREAEGSKAHWRSTSGVLLRAPRQGPSLLGWAEPLAQGAVSALTQAEPTCSLTLACLCLPGSPPLPALGPFPTTDPKGSFYPGGGMSPRPPPALRPPPAALAVFLAGVPTLPCAAAQAPSALKAAASQQHSLPFSPTGFQAPLSIQAFTKSLHCDPHPPTEGDEDSTGP